MAKGILGTKIGMTQVFDADGRLVPVTIVRCEPNVVLQKKTVEKDGYEAVQLGFKDKREKLANKPELGHFAKSKSTPKRYVREIAGKELGNFELGQEIRVDIFERGEIVDVTGTSKGKGFQGVIKRYGYGRGPMTHGSRYHRGPGSLGSIDPARVFKGTKLPGHMGTDTVTMQNLEIIEVDTDRDLLLIKGNVPGPKRGLVVVKRGIKTESIEPLEPKQYNTENDKTDESVE